MSRSYQRLTDEQIAQIDQLRGKKSVDEIAKLIGSYYQPVYYHLNKKLAKSIAAVASQSKKSVAQRTSQSSNSVWQDQKRAIEGFRGDVGRLIACLETVNKNLQEASCGISTVELMFDKLGNVEAREKEIGFLQERVNELKRRITSMEMDYAKRVAIQNSSCGLESRV